MVDTTSVLIAVLGGLVIAIATGWVHRDATRLEFERPWMWGGIVFVTMGVALTLHLVVGTIPIPGLLVIAVGGIALYLFERDDAVHGDEPADPHALPGEAERSRGNGGTPSSGDDSTNEETD